MSSLKAAGGYRDSLFYTYLAKILNSRSLNFWLDIESILKVRIRSMLMFQIIPSRVCGLKTLQDLSCCYLLAAGSHWNPWNNKLNLFVPLPEAQSELLLFESCYSSGKFNLNFMWSSGGTFRGTETRPQSQGWSKEVSLRQCDTGDTLQTRGADMMGDRKWSDQ